MPPYNRPPSHPFPRPVVSPTLHYNYALPGDVTQQFDTFAAPQPTLLTVQLDNVTAYIQDSLDLTSPPITGVTGSINSTTLTVSSGTGLAVGMGVSGAHIPAGATLVSGGPISWVLSIAAQVPASGVALTFTNIIVDLAHSAMQPNVSMDISSKPNNPTNPFYNMFPLVVVGDIVNINGDPKARGLYLSKNFVTISSSTPATAAPSTPSTPISAGQMIADAKIVGFRYDIFKMLYEPDPTVATLIEIGSITAAGVSGQPPIPPGGPLEIQGGDWAITGGTGAFLGATGQMGGPGPAPPGSTPTAIRMASVTEDPSQRRANAANPANPPATATMLLSVIPLMPPQIIGVFSFFDVSSQIPVSQTNPASVGDVLVLYATGLGPVRDQNGNAVPIGQPFPADLPVISPVTITIGKVETIENDVLVLTQGATFTPPIAQGVQGFSNGYSVTFELPDFSPPGLPGTTTIQISSAWIQSAVFTLYVAAG